MVLGDQLSPDLSSLSAGDPGRDLVLMCEVAEETTYVGHHKQKLVFILSAMRHFAEELRQAGWAVDYVELTDEGNSGSFAGEVARAGRRHEVAGILVTEPGEWRVLADIEGWEAATGLPVEIKQDSRFLCSRADFRRMGDGSQGDAHGAFLPRHAPANRASDGGRRPGRRQMELRRGQPQAGGSRSVHAQAAAFLARRRDARK